MRNIAITLTPITEVQAHKIKTAARSIAVTLQSTVQSELGFEAAERKLGVSLRPTLEMTTDFNSQPVNSINATVQPTLQASIGIAPVKQSIDVTVQAVVAATAHCADPRRNIHLEISPALILPTKTEAEVMWSSANW